MMDVLKVHQISSFSVFDLQMSEGELQILVDLIENALETLDDGQLHQVVTDEEQRENAPAAETRAFLENLRRELCTAIREHCDRAYLPDRFQRLT